MNALHHRDSGEIDSKSRGTFHTIHQVCVITGIEPARIRFIEREFSEYFGGPNDRNLTPGFDQQQVELLGKIHHLLFQKNETPFAIRRELSRNLRRLKTIAVTSGKGGVGKTTLSLNLAISMAARGQRTLLLDADMGLGNVHVFAGISPRGSIMDLIDGRQTAANLLSAGPGNIQVLCGNSGSARMADLSAQSIERLGHELAALGESFDVMIIDTGAGISSQVTRFLAMADDIVVVTTPNIAATLDAYGVIKVMREENMRGQIHLVVNQADSAEQSAAVSEKIRACSDRFLKYSPATLGSLMRDTAVENANQSRSPLVLSQPDHPNSKSIAQIAEKLRPPAAPLHNGVHQHAPSQVLMEGIAATAA